MKLLDAVNLILPKLGEHRVTRLDVKHPTLAIILPEVENELRTMLNKGWWFNEFDTTLYPDPEGFIYLGTEMLTFIPKDHDKAVQRGNRLYNPETLSYVFTNTVEGRVREYVPFDDIPESAGQAVYYRALANTYVTDIGLTAEVQAWSALAAQSASDLLAEHLRQRKYSTKRSPRFGRLRRAMAG